MMNFKPFTLKKSAFTDSGRLKKISSLFKQWLLISDRSGNPRILLLVL